MDITLAPGMRTGEFNVPSSKSAAHRHLIAAALSDNPVLIRCDGISDDISATAACLSALGAQIQQDTDSGIIAVKRGIFQTDSRHAEALLDCGESGSTLRFLLPLAGALDAEAVFIRKGRLPQRPISPLDKVLASHGMSIIQDGSLLRVHGKLNAGKYEIPGNISSQYITGLLLSLPLLGSDSILRITGPVESAGYISMTEEVLKKSGILFQKDRNGRIYSVPGRQRYSLGGEIRVEKDWSGAAFPLCIGALSETGVTVRGLDTDSSQGDRAVIEILERFGASVSISGKGENSAVTVRGRSLKGCTVDASQIPDLVPAVCALAGAAEGITRIVNAQRLRTKESDRIKTVLEMLGVLGVMAEESADGLTVYGGTHTACSYVVDPHGDHRIAMAASVGACYAERPVTVLGIGCADKSFPSFFDGFLKLKEVRS